MISAEEGMGRVQECAGGLINAEREGMGGVGAEGKKESAHTADGTLFQTGFPGPRGGGCACGGGCGLAVTRRGCRGRCDGCDPPWLSWETWLS